ncbi:cytoplasmic protein [Cryptococcus neoformans AD2-60a]|nr:cytoplasmic protein [Cryptococcus neoformans var. grubii AD2-60a]
MADAKKKQLVYNIIDFLRTSSQDGTIKEDDKESLDVAVQCIAEAFGVDPDSAEDEKAYSIKPASLVSILDVFLKTKAKTFASASPHSEASVPQSSTDISETDKIKAESLKTKGNQLMGQKLYDSAIEQYTEAIKLDPNPVYYSNRAAAWGGAGQHEKAVEDAEKALQLDPKFTKAYSRLGHAHFSLGNYSDAVTAYENGLELDPNNANMKTALSTAKSKLAESSPRPTAADREPPQNGNSGNSGGMPDLASLASALGGGGGSGSGGMPDLASMINNPQMMAMAQQMMANGGLERLMQNPTLRNMAENMRSGGGMPDFSSLANDPSMKDLAQQFMGGRQ